MSKQTRGDQPNLGRAAPDSPQPDIDRGPPGVQLIRVDPRSIKWPDKRVRAGWNDSELAGLATSMRTVGQQEPVLAHIWPDGNLEGIGGYNRCLAAIQGGIAEVECLTRPGSHRDTVRMNLASDAKKDNDPWSLVEAAAHAYNDEGFSLDEIADVMNHAPGWVQDCLAIADSSPAVQQYFRDGIMTRGHAVLLARVDDQETQEHFLRLYLDSAPRWTVPQLEQAMREDSPANLEPHECRCDDQDAHDDFHTLMLAAVRVLAKSRREEPCSHYSLVPNDDLEALQDAMEWWRLGME